jgi:TldD protein
LQELLLHLMDAAARHCDYADVRHVRVRAERVAMRNGELAALDTHEEEGIGVRVLANGAWGFAASGRADRGGCEAALSRALAVARTQPRAPGRPLTPEPPARGSWHSALEQEPLAVPVEDKVALLARADAAMRAEPRVAVALASVNVRVENKLFASTEAAQCEQRTTSCGGGIEAIAVNGDATQIRSYPGSHSGHVAQAGWEHVIELDLPGNAPRVAEEAAALLDAPPCPEGETALILAGEQLGLQVHESVGHAIELDRMLGLEASYAGTSFVPPDAIGSLRYGSAQMSITADARLPGALGTYAWDDEGVEARTLPIVREGVLRGVLSGRESAAAIGLPHSGGCMRAEGFGRQPLVRMTNVSLDPGQAGTLDELIGDTARGVLIETNRSWSIDSRRLHFQFGGEAAWEIVGGQLRRLLREPVYAGVTPEFWARLDGVCSAPEWRLVSITNCGKGEPGQFVSVSHGGAPARFAGVRVGSG